MGRKPKNGEPSLSKHQLDALRPLVRECIETKLNIDNHESMYASLQHWVKAKAIPRYNNVYHTPASPYQEEQIYVWYKNLLRKSGVVKGRTSANDGLAKSPLPVPDPMATSTENFSARSKGIRDLVADDFSQELKDEARLREGEKPFIATWNEVLTEKVKSLPPEKLEEYSEKIRLEDERRKKAPRKVDILEEQEHLKGKMAQSIRELLGWERKQYGDAVCFLVTTYRDRSNAIQEFRFLVSNRNRYIENCDGFLSLYDKEMAGSLGNLAGKALPRHTIDNLPLIDVLLDGTHVISKSTALDAFTLQELRNLLQIFIERVWVASCVNHQDPGAVPWHLLSDAKGRALVLQDPTPFESHPSLDPSTMSLSSIVSLLEVLSSPDHSFSFRTDAALRSRDALEAPIPHTSPGTPQGLTITHLTPPPDDSLETVYPTPASPNQPSELPISTTTPSTSPIQAYSTQGPHEPLPVVPNTPTTPASPTRTHNNLVTQNSHQPSTPLIPPSTAALQLTVCPRDIVQFPSPIPGNERAADPASEPALNVPVVGFGEKDDATTKTKGRKRKPTKGSLNSRQLEPRASTRKAKQPAPIVPLTSKAGAASETRRKPGWYYAPEADSESANASPEEVPKRKERDLERSHAASKRPRRT